MLDRNVHRTLLTTACLGGIFFAVGLGWRLRPAGEVDRSFRLRAGAPVEESRKGRPEVRILIDQAHDNGYQAEGGLLPFARVARDQGFRTRTVEERLTLARLRDFQVLVSVNPHHTPLWGGQAFNEAEVAAIQQWVRAGGGLLLAADWSCGDAAESLASAFGVIFESIGTKADPALFTRELEQLGGHEILTPEIRRVSSYHGRWMKAPPGAAALLLRREQAQAVALRHGDGRVVVLGDAAMIGARFRRTPTGIREPIGMNRADSDNGLFARNCLRWLARRL